MNFKIFCPNLGYAGSVLKIAVLAVLAALFSCENGNVPNTDIIVSKGVLPEMTSKNTEILYSDSAVVKMKLNATVVEKFTQGKTPHTLFPSGVTILFFDNFGRKNSSLKADYAKYYEKEKIWEFKSNVSLINQQKDVLKTQHLLVDIENEMMYSKKLVDIEFGDGSSLGSEGGFRANLDFTDYEFTDVSNDLDFWGEDEEKRKEETENNTVSGN